MNTSTSRLLLFASIVLSSCSTVSPCDPTLQPPLEPIRSAHDAILRHTCDHLSLSAGPFCVRHLAGRVLPGPQPGNQWAAYPGEPTTDPWLEIVGPLPANTHRVRQLSSAGQFDFGPLEAGRYLAKASACGWQSAYFLVTVSPSAPTGDIVVVELPLD